MSHRLTKEELDEQFELFLKESVSDDSVDFGILDKKTSIKNCKKPAQKPTVSWWPDDDHSDGGTGRVMVPAVNTATLGVDTLEEEEEKARFFSQLEAAASSTIDYSRLNKELDSTGSSDLRKAKEEEEQIYDDQKTARVMETIRESPGSPLYSEDFEEDDEAKEPQEKDLKMSQFLTKVCLHDSLEDMGEDNRRKTTAGSLDRGQSCVQSWGSEIDALHEAYRQIHVVEALGDHHYPDQDGNRTGVKTNRPTSPSPSPCHARQSLQPASTAESELPTAEELMRPIHPEMDQIRGFSLQPVSTVDFDKKKKPHLLEKTFPGVTSQEVHLTHPGKTDRAPGEKGTKGSTDQHFNSSDSPDYNLTWDIRQEVDSLMKESNTLPQAGETKKQQTSLGSTFSRPSISSVRKPTTTSMRDGKVEGRAGVTSRCPSKTQSAVSRPLLHPQGKTKLPKSQEKENYTADPSLRVSGELVSSVQSLVSILKQQMDTSLQTEAADKRKVDFLQDTRSSHHTQNIQREDEEDERSLVEELRARLAQRERELQTMKEEAKEITALRQQNFLLQSKLRSAEEMSQKKRSGQAADSAPEERLQQLDKEIKEQETLIKGYQQENEKLYLQMKRQQAKSKANEEAMFNENQTLLNQLAFTRDQISTNSRPVGNVCLMDHSQRIRDLLAQIDMFQRNEAKLGEDVHRLKQDKQALEEDLQLMKKERDLAKSHAVSTSGEKTLVLRMMEEKHQEEVLALRKKLQWFAENQDLLDRDASRLKAATAEIHRLKEQVEKLTSDVSKQSSDQQRKAREKTVEAKKTQDLERQVKELERILRHRNPNSLPALIYAAATACGSEDADAATTSLSRINTLLERRIQGLEAELESHDEEAKRSLRALEQHFHRIKLRYEQQISDMEQQLEQKQLSEDTDLKARPEPWMSQVQTLEELQRVKEIHQEKEKSLQDQIESLHQQLKQKAQPSLSRHQQQAEAAFGIRIERLNQELAAKTRTIQELSHTVEKLQREGRGMMFVPNPRPEPRPAESKKKSGPTKTVILTPGDKTWGGDEMFPTAQYEKTYQPTIFTGSHISEVQQENEDLRRDLELLQLQSEREKKALKAEAAQAREELSRLQENSAEQLSSQKAHYVLLLDQLHATHALEHSASRVAELTNKLQTQEIVVKHLQDQLKELQGTKSALAISRTREDALQKQLTRLLQQLKDAKEAQSPEVKLLCGLERKISNIELKHQHREKELQQVIGSMSQTLGADQQSEVERWKRLAQHKSSELQDFRLELDSILDILKHLQRQGVVLTPITTPTIQKS